MVQHASTLELAAHGHVPTVSHTIMFLDTSAMSRCTLLVWQGVDGWRETDVWNDMAARLVTEIGRSLLSFSSAG